MELVYQSSAPDNLWKPNPHRVYLFWGEEDRLKAAATDALVRHLVSPDFADFDFEALDAPEIGADGVLASVGQIPFGSERRVVVARGLEQWRQKASEAERLAEGIARLGDTACLILVAAAGEEEGKRKTGVTVKLDNAVKKHGAVVTFPALKSDALLTWVREQVQKEGKQISREAAQQLIESAGEETLLLEQEILKLVLWVGERDTITPRDVSIQVVASPEDVLFTVIDAITRRQTDRALTLLGELHRHDPKPQAVAGKLLALLARQYRMLWQAKYLAEKRISPRDVRNLPPEMAAELPTESNIAQLAFKAADLFALSKNYTWTELKLALERLLLCDLANKGGVTEESALFGSDPAGNLQLLVLELTGAGRRRVV